MPRQEQIQRQKRPSREESVSTLPENYRRANGDPRDGVEEILGEIDEILAEKSEATRKVLGHLGIEAA